MKTPFYGSRKMTVYLNTLGYEVNRKIEKGASHVGMSINTYKALWTEKGKDRWER
jgi:hypothetical protein